MQGSEPYGYVSDDAELISGRVLVGILAATMVLLVSLFAATFYWGWQSDQCSVLFDDRTEECALGGGID